MYHSFFLFVWCPSPSSISLLGRKGHIQAISIRFYPIGFDYYTKVQTAVICVYESLAMYNDRTRLLVGQGKSFGGILISPYYFWSNEVHMARNGIHNTWQRFNRHCTHFLNYCAINLDLVVTHQTSNLVLLSIRSTIKSWMIHLPWKE